MQFGLLVFPNVQQLDLTGPYEVFASWPQARVRLVAKTLNPVTSSTGLVLKPDASFDNSPQLDVLCVPGGAGVNAPDGRRRDNRLRATTGGRGAVRHLGVHRGRSCSALRDCSKENARPPIGRRTICSEVLGADPRQARVVRDGDLMTGGGVTAGVDFALALIAEVAAGRSPRRSSSVSNMPPRRRSTPAAPRRAGGDPHEVRAQAHGAGHRGAPPACRGSGARGSGRAD